MLTSVSKLMFTKSHAIDLSLLLCPYSHTCSLLKCSLFFFHQNLLEKPEEKKNEAALSMVQCKLLPVS